MQYDHKALLEGIRAGDRGSLARAITLIESKHPIHLSEAAKLLKHCQPYIGDSKRIAITGSPGVGKSTFIEAIGLEIIKEGGKPAVLAIDPSSKTGGGSILGDKTRMNSLSAHKEAFIRPSPSLNYLGGVTATTREAMILCEAAGFDHILIETVGVGQSETEVKNMVDCFVLLVLPGSGDHLQGIKKGIMELADILVINKADGRRLILAKESKSELDMALHLLPAKENNWEPLSLMVSSTEGICIEDFMIELHNFFLFTRENGSFGENRKNQLIHWFDDAIKEGLWRKALSKESFQIRRERLLDKLKEGDFTIREAVEDILMEYF